MLCVTCFGHAAVLVESEATRILMDPILRDSVSEGGNVIDPGRRVYLDSLTALEAVIISHHHADHYNLQDLALIPEAQAQHFIIPDDKRMERELRTWGASKVTRMTPWQSITLADVELTATPSDVPFPEMGMLFRQGETRLLNLVDSVSHPHWKKITEVVGLQPDLVLAPFQAGGGMSFLPLRQGGPPPRLAQAVQRWSEEYLFELTQDLAELKPKLTAAFADGLIYVDAGINARHFPLPDFAFLQRLSEFGLRACVARPALRFELGGVEPRIGEGDKRFIEASRETAADRSFNLAVPLSDRPLSWFELPLGGNGRIDDLAWRAKLPKELHSRLESLVSSDGHAAKLNVLSEWHLELLGDGNPVVFCPAVDTKNQIAGVEQWREAPAERPYGIVCHGADLLEVAEGRLSIDALYLGGLIRYRSPESDVELERLRGRTLSPFMWLFGS